jgi:hypothetical protein
VARSRVDETASSRARRPAGKVMRSWDRARERRRRARDRKPRARKDSSHSRAVASRKMQYPTLFGSTISRGLSHRRGNSAFTASLTADTAGHHPTDDEADDSIPDDVAFRTIYVVCTARRDRYIWQRWIGLRLAPSRSGLLDAGLLGRKIRPITPKNRRQSNHRRGSLAR